MPAVQTTFICVALTTSWIIPSGSKAESNQLSLDKCFQMQFPDVLQIETCLGGSLDMCGESHRGVLDDVERLNQCVKMHEYICTSAGINKDELVPKLMNMVVCIFNKLPGVDVKNILRVFLCRIMSMLIGYLRMQNIGDAFEPIYDALHTLGNCKSSRPISQKAEKRILRDLQFRLARADLRLQ
ncbi:uncharacterized protein LOC144138191 isoform X3 [Haemaphysalis longicornis]